MKSTDELRHNHEIILHMLSDAEQLAQVIKATRSVDSRKVKEIIDFSRLFTDRCHHAKEEKHLFIRLQERGMLKEQGPIAVMLHEHNIGRTLIQGIETALKEYQNGELKSIETISQIIMQYVELLRSHITKENNILFPMCDRLLTFNDQQSLEQSFKEIEENEVGFNVHEKYHHMAHVVRG